MCRVRIRASSCSILLDKALNRNRHESERMRGPPLCWRALPLPWENPGLGRLVSVRQGIESKSARQRAHARATTVLASLAPDLEESDWYSRGWLDEVFAQIGAKFNEACERWRGLCRAALKQAQAQDQIIRDASRSAEDRKQAERLRKEAE